eukprot:9317893-Pyramimonas_sp.AAC.1
MFCLTGPDCFGLEGWTFVLGVRVPAQCLNALAKPSPRCPWQYGGPPRCVPGSGRGKPRHRAPKQSSHP